MTCPNCKKELRAPYIVDRIEGQAVYQCSSCQSRFLDSKLITDPPFATPEMLTPYDEELA